MDVLKLKDMVRGWFIGNFEPSVYKTEDFEVAVMLHPKDQQWPAHYHKLATEINLVLEGRLIIQDQLLVKDDIFIIHPFEVVKPQFLEDCRILVVKTLSIPNDKYIVKE